MSNDIPKVSVIIPVYNVEEYLYDCINSLIDQTLKDIEIICINDKSTDSSGEILEYFAKKDNRIKILENEENLGQGESRNRGLKHSTGEYIQFLDSDDWLDKDCLETLYNKAKEHDADLIMFKLINYDQDTGKFFKTGYYSMDYMEKFYEKELNQEIMHDYVFRVPNSPCNKLYKTSLIKENNFEFPKGLIHEDNPFYFNMVLTAKKILITDKYFYNRRIRSNSTTTTINNRLIDMLEIADIVLTFFLDNNYYQDYKKYLLNYLINVMKSKFYLIPFEFKDEYYSKMKKQISRYINAYGMKNDFDEVLSAPNKKFLNMVLNSDNLEIFDKNIQMKKGLKSDYKISVIIPVYNAKKEDLMRAFNSLLKQTIKFENLEVLFIDDKSSFLEGTYYIKELNDMYTNVKSIFLKENKGSGNARNVGINHAKGKYIMFLDHDDYYYNNACETLYNTIEKENVDLTSGNYVNLATGKKMDWSNKVEDFTKVSSVLENMKIFLTNPAVWTKIYKKEFLNSKNIRFKNFKAGQDLIFNQETLFKADGVVFINKPIVGYRIREGKNQQLSSMSLNNSKKILNTLLKVYSTSYDLFMEYNDKYTHIPLNTLNYYVNSRLLNSNLTYDEFKSLFSSYSLLIHNYMKNEKVNKQEIPQKLFSSLLIKDFYKAYDFYLESKN